MAAETRVGEAIAPAVAAAGLVLEKVTVTPAGKRKVVRVVVDLPETETGALDLDKVAEVSRLISDAMDSAEPLGSSPYVLEVSSPGVTRPLTERRHWARARTRLVKTTVDGRELLGRVAAVDDDGVHFTVGEPDSPEAVEQVVDWNSLGTGKVQIEFSRPDEESEASDDELDELDEASEIEEEN